MGIRFYCPNGHKLNVKEFQAGRKGICPFCGTKILIPTESNRPSSKDHQGRGHQAAATPAETPVHVATEQPGIVAFDPAPAPAQAIAAQPTAAASSAHPTSTPVAASMPSVATFAAAPTEVPTPAAAPSTADPLAEAANVVWYVRPSSGGQFGPAAGDVMRSWLTEGRISADSLVWREGWRDWQEASEVFPQLSPGFVAPGLEAVLAEPVAPVHSHRPAAPQRSRGMQVMIVVVLVVAVLVLAGVLIAVVMNL